MKKKNWKGIQTYNSRQRYRNRRGGNLIDILTYTPEMISKHRRKRTKKKTMYID